jgi:hypothetical protein
MNKRIIIPLVTLIYLISACAESASINSSPTSSSGVEGYVTEGPMCPGPVSVGDTSCPDRPYQATISILDTDNKKITQFQTDPTGYFKITLPAGTYILHPESEVIMPYASDQVVVVTQDQFTLVSVMYDTGMR